MTNRNVKLDFIKTVAIFFVIGIHCIASALFEYPIGSKHWDIIAFYRSFVSPAVPLFFMCSGALLFDKDKLITIKNIFKKYIPRVLIALFFWAFVYEVIQILYRYHSDGMFKKSSIFLAIDNIIHFNHNYQLYFIYIMILFYLFTPVIKIFINNAKKDDLKYMLLVWVALGIVLPNFISLPEITKFHNFTQYIIMGPGYSSIIYGLLGYYILHNRKKTSHYTLCFIMGILLSFLLSYYICVSTNTINIQFWGGTSITVMLSAYGFFGMIVSSDLKIYSSKFVNSISKASFSIFLTHDIFLKILSILNIKVSSLPSIINVPIFVIIVFICSYVLYLILSKIKYVNKYLI